MTVYANMGNRFRLVLMDLSDDSMHLNESLKANGDTARHFAGIRYLGPNFRLLIAVLWPVPLMKCC